MGSPKEEATAAIHRFYDALDGLLRHQGAQAMGEIWHHADYVSTSHPWGHWARGWAEVWATWEEAGQVFALYHGHDERGGHIGGISDLAVSVHGDAAFATSIYQSKLYMADAELDLRVNCTNVVYRVDGEWRIVHHHADQAPPPWQAAIGRMVERGHS